MNTMKRHLKSLAYVIVIYHFGLLMITLALSAQAKVLHPLSGKHVDVDGYRMHVIGASLETEVVKKSDGFDVVVLLHGSSTSSLDYSTNLLPMLSEQFPVIAIDRPGHGYSDRIEPGAMHDPERQANVILDTVKVLGFSKPILVGHSWAGAVVLSGLLLDHTDVDPVAGIIISGVTHSWNNEDTLPTRLSLKPYFGTFFRWLYLSPIGRFMISPTVEKSFQPEEVPDNYIQNVGLVLSLRPTTYLYNARDRSYLSNHLAENTLNYSKIDVPVLSIASLGDKIVNPSAHHEKLLVDVKNSYSRVFENAGHSPHHTRTDKVIDEITDFITKLKKS